MSIWTLLPPLAHRRARALASQAIDEARDAVALDPGAQRWLAAHLERCPDCARHAAELSRAAEALAALETVPAPQGFAGRVLLAARARGRAAPEPAREASWLRPAALALGAALAVGGAWLVVAPPGGRGGDTLISGTGSARREVVHFTVRAPGLGAARARSQITTIVREHGGSFTDEGGRLLARVPRGALVALTQDLARSGRFRVSRADGGELQPDEDWIHIRFDLD